ncbi:MAG: ABC transporter permease [Patescibacteria group bacterium]
MKVIYILWLRQIKRYLRSKARMIGSLGQPLLFLLALGFGFGPIYQKAGEGSYLQFLGPGVIAMAIIFTAIFTGIEIIWDRQFGFLKETLVAPASRFQIMIGRTMGGATVATLQGIIVFLMTLVVGFRPTDWLLLPLALVFMILIALVFTAFGTAIATMLQDMQAFPIIMNFLIMPIFFLSGALFPLESFPAPIVTATKINPLVYGVDGLRGALIQGAHLGLLTDFIVLSLITLGLLALGSYLFSKIEV